MRARRGAARDDDGARRLVVVVAVDDDDAVRERVTRDIGSQTMRARASSVGARCDVWRRGRVGGEEFSAKSFGSRATRTIS